MDEHDALAGQFELYRGQLRAVAARMLGSLSEADDAVQEAWLRLSRADVSGVASLEAWLRTVVSRICLDLLRARQSRREEPWAGRWPPRPRAAARPRGPTRSVRPCSSTRSAAPCWWCWTG